MNNIDMMKILAELDCLKIDDTSSYIRREADGRLWLIENDIPIFYITDNYMANHNAVQRILYKMDKESINKYNIELDAICQRDNPDKSSSAYATAPQKCEAIIKSIDRCIE
jgi:hypothetical protein